MSLPRFSPVVLLMLAPVVLAQNQPPAPAVRAGAAQPPRRTVTLPSGPQAYESLVERDTAGMIIRLKVPLDVAALRRNPLVDQATREKLRPVIREWLAEVDRSVIDNLDFVEELEPSGGGEGILAKFDSSNADEMRRINQFMTQLGGAGSLTNQLSASGVMTRDQFGLNQQITSDYLQATMKEAIPPVKPGLSEAEGHEHTNRYHRFLFSVNARDPLMAYHRMLEGAAPRMAKLVADLQLSAEEQAGLKERVAAAAAAEGAEARRQASRAVLNQLTFDQRRALLRQAAELNPPFEPFPETADQSQTSAPRAGE